MSGRAQTVAHLRAGNCMRFHLKDLSFVEGQEMIDDLERLVGAPLERIESIEADGLLLYVWVRGLGAPPVLRQYERVGNGPDGFAAD